ICPDGTLSGVDRGGCYAGTATAIFHADERQLQDQQASTRPVRVCKTGPDARSAIFQARFDCLPECADLSQQPTSEKADGDVSLCAQAHGVFAAGGGGIDWREQRSVCHGRQAAPALYEEKCLCSHRDAILAGGTDSTGPGRSTE